MIPEKLRNAPKWCVSKDKMPLDMYALARGLEWGASTRRSHPCYTDFDTALEASKTKNLPVTLWIDSQETGYYAIDIEKECPARIRRGILLALHDHIDYLERSLSGKGYHLMVRLAAPKACTTVKYRKWVEILSSHHCTFTMKEISFQEAYDDEFPENETVGLWDEDVNPDDLEAKRDQELLDLLSAPLTPEDFYDKIGENRTAVLCSAMDAGDYKAALATFDGRHADLFNGLCDMVYEKTVDDFSGDMSRWEFGCASKMHYLLQRLSRDMMAADMSHYQVTLDQAQAVMLVYMALKHTLPPREKHKTIRNGMPWLLYTSQQVYVKSFGQGPSETKSGSGTMTAETAKTDRR